MAMIGVFLGSGEVSILYVRAAKLLGQEIAARGHTLVCGANGSGLMGNLIESVLNGGGNVVGILPQGEDIKEIPHPRLENINFVKTISDRKKAIRDISDVVIAFPGGIGTLDEFFEAYALKRAGLFSKPIGLLNLNDFYQFLILQIDVAVNEKFAKAKHRELVIHSSDPVRLLDSLFSDSMC
jgi:uncharacterized protein (TIGR00730 family)